MEERNLRALVQRREELHLALHQLEQLASFLARGSLDSFDGDGVSGAGGVLDVAAEDVRSRAAHADYLLLVVYDGIADASPCLAGRSAGAA